METKDYECFYTEGKNRKMIFNGLAKGKYNAEYDFNTDVFCCVEAATGRIVMREVGLTAREFDQVIHNINSSL